MNYESIQLRLHFERLNPFSEQTKTRPTSRTPSGRATRQPAPPPPRPPSLQAGYAQDVQALVAAARSGPASRQQRPAPYPGCLMTQPLPAAAAAASSQDTASHEDAVSDPTWVPTADEVAAASPPPVMRSHVCGATRGGRSAGTAARAKIGGSSKFRGVTRHSTTGAIPVLHPVWALQVGLHLHLHTMTFCTLPPVTCWLLPLPLLLNVGWSNASLLYSFRPKPPGCHPGRYEAHLWDAAAPRPKAQKGKRTRGKQIYLGGYQVCKVKRSALLLSIGSGFALP